MHTLTEAIRELPEFAELLTRIGKAPGSGAGAVAAVGGLSLSHKAHMIAAVRAQLGRPLLLVCADEAEASRLRADVAALTGEEVASLPYREPAFYPVDSASREWEIRRLGILYRLEKRQLPLLVTTPDALMLRTMPPEVLRSSSMELKVGGRAEPGELTAFLTAAGYVRCDRVEGTGQFAARGEIVDVFTPAYEKPIRIDFFDDEIDAIGLFDTETQRRTDVLNNAVVMPAAEVLPGACEGGTAGLAAKLEKLITSTSRRKKLPEGLLKTLNEDLERLRETGHLPVMDRYLPLVYPRASTAADYLSEDTVVFLDESGRLTERAQRYTAQINEDAKYLMESGILTASQTALNREWEEILIQLEKYPLAELESFLSASLEPRPRALLTVTAKQLPSYGGSLETAIQDVVHYRRENYTTVLLASSERRARQLAEMLEQAHPVLDFDLLQPLRPGVVCIGVGNLSGGMEYPGIRLAVITEGQLTAAETRRRKAPKKDSKNRIQSYTDLTPGDLVVHDLHGIGRFEGIEKIRTENGLRDYIRLVYAGTDVLFIPATQLGMISKYVGAPEETQVKLNRLGGTDWQRTKTRAKAAAKDMAKKLIAIYAERARRPGYAFPKDDDWQQEFEESFEYDETDAQLRCTAEIKADMEKPIPMDRLLCGDVGFGKTEVALRAVMKCVLAGKQAAILVPTTVLARQHYLTAVRRFSRTPVKIEILSRFQTAAQVRETKRRLSEGLADVVIGTHKLLNKDIRFKDLGLLVIDEEQRFGVTHKERLREMAKNVDTLTMTATPIPRTLNMALLGVRDMSTLEEAPRDRQPVQTYVLEQDNGVLTEAIRREINRGGQVYYLHNRVETIDRVAARIKAAMPEVTVGVAHGQMNEEGLAEVMNAVSEGAVQVLVCTTIIETGIDIPNVNTLIIEDADKLGLAQLHQIRGRVGRSPRHAYAYLTYRRGKILTEVGTKRLSAMREFAGFGAGFQIAMRDLEIRGAGNILGMEQSGHMIDVGYDLYLKLLEEAVLEEKGETPQKRAECTAEIAVNAHIPQDYVPVNEERMDLYRRFAFIREKGDFEDLLDELLDRYGEPPEAVHNLLRIALLRAAASRADITEITQREGQLFFALAKPDYAQISALCGERAFRGRILLNAGDKPYVSIRLRSGENPLAMAESVVDIYGKAKHAAE